ncbi:hypothetical protein FHX42_004420 [Saccharopolyspora lacisalsi]|uniref:Uncharacterized protein n=1 Tax=Halosaccharopolyspora lacisalsi TaxID=1000566 RepID=A0A839E380_9PSEU|nr:hypothetical protein [Halosaccharopolyspora lacisalsi]MBA8827036.1 hypothetical protein [Halosaccharopolyspora lacisalsi]
MTRMFPQVVWWVVPAGQSLRHATRQEPGAQMDGGPLAVLCGAEAKVPFTTPAGTTPRSVGVWHRCRDCEAVELSSELRHHDWDS